MDERDVILFEQFDGGYARSGLRDETLELYGKRCCGLEWEMT